MIIGSDESLKGDTFGGLVVAAVKADETSREQLVSLGVVDSKKLSDRQIIRLAEKIRELCRYHVISLFPFDYNKRIKQSGLTALLNALHRECYQQVKPGKHIVDEYPNCSVGDVITPKAESKYVEVAAASILARAAALQQIEELSQRAGFTIPLGSTHVREGLEQLRKKGLPFEEFVKVDFKNVQKFLGQTGKEK